MPRGDGTGPAGGGGPGTGGGRGGGQGGGMGRGQGGGGGRGRMGGRGAGPGGQCVCTQCGKTFPHERGVPCMSKQCPECGVALARQG
jgi:hypothetical protein